MEGTSSIINGREADMLLYGEIVNDGGCGGYVSSKNVVTEIINLSLQCDTIRVHINSEGGEVYAGIAIFNALRASAKDITIYTDGVSASIAGIIAMCGRKHYMSKHSRLMIHSVSAGVYGDKNQLLSTVEEIKALENTLSEIISERMGCSPEEVKERFFDGEDHWFTAPEAVAAGLADGIYDIGVELSESDSAKDVYTKVFTNRAVMRSQIINNMDIEKFKVKPRFTNVVSEEDVFRTIDDLNTKIDELESERQTLQERILELQNDEIEKILEAAVAAGKINEGEKENYRNLMNKDRVSTEAVLNSLRPKRSVKSDITGGDDKSTKVSPWDKRMAEIHNQRHAIRS